MDIYNNIPIKLKQLQLQDEVKFGLNKKKTTNASLKTIETKNCT